MNKITRPRIFLTAEWNNLVMLNYAVDASLLRQFVPTGTELDSLDGIVYLSLVGFEFNRTSVLGFRVPFHQAFEEVNLRFYVKRSSKRGVVFLQELVPKRAVAALARFAFNENYSRVPMSHRVVAQPNDEVVKAEYSWGTGLNQCKIWIETEGPSSLPAEGSVSQFITEHYWGYAAQKDGGCLEYEVQHPRWHARSARLAGCEGNLAVFYGTEFARVLAGNPASAFLADGSAVSVFNGTRIS